MRKGRTSRIGRPLGLSISERDRLPALRDPVEHAHRAKRVPAARVALAVLHLEMYLSGVDGLERPTAVGIPIGLDDTDRLGDALVRRVPRCAQVVETAEDVEVPPGRE